MRRLAVPLASSAQAQLERNKATDTLSFSLPDRVVETGLDWFPAEGMPTEEAMIKFEKLSKAGAGGAYQRRVPFALVGRLPHARIAFGLAAQRAKTCSAISHHCGRGLRTWTW